MGSCFSSSPSAAVSLRGSHMLMRGPLNTSPLVEPEAMSVWMWSRMLFDVASSLSLQNVITPYLSHTFRVSQQQSVHHIPTTPYLPLPHNASSYRTTFSPFLPSPARSDMSPDQYLLSFFGCLASLVLSICVSPCPLALASLAPLRVMLSAVPLSNTSVVSPSWTPNPLTSLSFLFFFLFLFLHVSLSLAFSLNDSRSPCGFSAFFLLRPALSSPSCCLLIRRSLLFPS